MHPLDRRILTIAAFAALVVIAGYFSMAELRLTLPAEHIAQH